MTTQTIQDHQSRWGYHSCSYADFRKLKSLHKWYWQAVYDKARWERWARKTINQHGPEPKHYHFSQEDGELIRYLYQEARMPRQLPGDVTRFNTYQLERIHDLYEDAKEWYLENRPKYVTEKDTTDYSN